MEKQLLVIQHCPWEGPGKFLLKAAKHHKVKLHVIKVYQQDIPSTVGYDGVLILGGSPNVDEEEKFSFLVREKEFIKEAIATDSEISRNVGCFEPSLGPGWVDTSYVSAKANVGGVGWVRAGSAAYTQKLLS